MYSVGQTVRMAANAPYSITKAGCKVLLMSFDVPGYILREHAKYSSLPDPDVAVLLDGSRFYVNSSFLEEPSYNVEVC